MKNPNNPMARQNGLVVQEMPDEVLVYDLDSNKAHCLNQSAAFVWRSCDGNKSVMDIVREFEANGKGKVTEDFVWLAIDQLSENGLLDGSIPQRFQGQSRRQVLKTIGLVSVVAVPVIASLVAPKSALGAVSCSCTTSAQCAQKSGQCPAPTCNNNGVCAP
jgi:Coenzyme PQQ synthesis protein D (PqqD)